MKRGGQGVSYCTAGERLHQPRLRRLINMTITSLVLPSYLSTAAPNTIITPSPACGSRKGRRGEGGVRLGHGSTEGRKHQIRS